MLLNKHNVHLFTRQLVLFVLLLLTIMLPFMSEDMLQVAISMRDKAIEKVISKTETDANGKKTAVVSSQKSSVMQNRPGLQPHRSVAVGKQSSTKISPFSDSLHEVLEETGDQPVDHRVIHAKDVFVQIIQSNTILSQRSVEQVSNIGSYFCLIRVAHLRVQLFSIRLLL